MELAGKCMNWMAHWHSKLSICYSKEKYEKSIIEDMQEG